MSHPTQNRQRVRFGVFTVDFAARELRKNGDKTPLQTIPFEILSMLVERPGEWVTREEFRERLWAADTFVDFDHSINTAVRKLRKVLGDDAEEPRYIETLPRHGYRLIASLADPPAHEDSEGEKKRFWKYVAPSAVFLLLALTAVWLFHPERKVQALTDKDTIVLADIENRTGDEVFDDALRQALAVELEQSPFLNVISDQKVNETLGMMGLPANQRITEEVGRELCQRVGSKALLIGTISRLGSHYLIGLNAEACRTGDTLAREQGEAATKEDVLKAVSRATASLRNKLGESLPSVQKFDVPVEATTSSLEALRYFDVGLTLRRKEGDAAGLPFLHRSVELDPNFASAYSELALSYDNLEQPSRALEYAGRAYQLRDRATKKEQLSITALYFGATGELDKEMQAYEVWAADYPRSPVPHFNLGADYVLMAHYDRALPELEEALRLAPDNVNIYTGLGSTFLYMNRLDEAKSTFDEALARKLDDGGIRQYMYYLAFLRGDAAQMEEDVSWAAGKPGDEDTLFALQADTEAYHGQMNKEREFTIRAVDSAIRADSRETAAMWKAHAAWCEAEVGNAASARQAVAEALALSRGRDVTVQAALALARSGDESQANSLAEDLRKSYPNDTLLKLYWLPSINAAIDLNNGNASHALSVLEGAAPFDLAEGLALHPAYLRGLAYLQSHNGMAAAAEFQKLLDHKSIVLNFVTGSLAHLQIGRAYAMAGDRAKAKAAYQDFFALWKDADAGSTLLKQAKAEYAKLQ